METFVAATLVVAHRLSGRGKPRNYGYIIVAAALVAVSWNGQGRGNAFLILCDVHSFLTNKYFFSDKNFCKEQKFFISSLLKTDYSEKEEDDGNRKMGNAVEM